MKRSLITNNTWYKSMLVGNLPSDYELIATAFGTGSSGTITFSSIPQNYKHLQIRYTAKATLAATNLEIRFNNDSTVSYIRHGLFASGSTVTSNVSPAPSASRTYIGIQQGITSSDTANAVGAGVIDILDYASTSKNTTVRGLYGMADANTIVSLFSGGFFKTDAITEISLFSNLQIGTVNFANISRFSLYGIKG
jgi:hypothetical protein